MTMTPPETSPVLRTTATPDDVAYVRDIVASTGFFSEAEIAVAVELIEDRVTRGDASDYRFVFADRNERAIGYACYGPIPCTIGSFDLYWIAVHDRERGRGLGRRLLREAERRIHGESGRQVYVETSSRDQYRSTRAFYEKNGYERVATFPDFYARGDDKVVYVKPLNASGLS